MKNVYIYCIAVIFFTLSFTGKSYSQCANDNTLWIDLTPPSCPGTSSTTCIFGGEYCTVSVTSGNTYTFQTCGDTDFDTQITLYNQGSGANVGYSDDDCGMQSTITWLATFTGVVRVLVDQWNCIDVSTCMTLSVSCSPPLASYNHPVSGLQNTYLGACMVNTCNANYYDDGGAGSNYSSNINSIYRTFCPSQPNNCLRATFTSFSTESGYDYFYVMNGPTQNSPQSFGGPWSGTTGPGTVTSTDASGCLGFRFYSDNIITSTGWAATLSCIPCAGGPTATEDNNCNAASSVCGMSPTTGAATGPGLTSECSGCVVAENYTNWYKIYIGASGTLSLTINPVNNAEDYDFALWGPNVSCGSVSGTAPVRCSYADITATGSTGMGNGAVDNSEDVLGDGWVSTLAVTAGQTYTLLVNGWTSASSGFNIQWTGSTATLGVPPGSVTAQTNNTCAGLNDGSACAVVNAGLPPYSYSWNTGASTQCISGQAPGTYNVTVTDGSGCVSTASGTVSNFGTPSVSLTPVNVTCSGGSNGSVSSSPSGGTSPYTFSWSNGPTTQNISGLTAGSYSVTVTDANGCTTNSSTSITAPSPLVAGSIAANQAICYNADAALLTSTTAASGGSGTINYQWQRDIGCTGIWADIGGATAATYDPPALTQTTCYRRKATDVCTSVYTSSVTITVTAQSVAGTASTTQSICYNTSTTLTLAGYTGTIQWQSSPDNSVWINIGGATGANYATPNLTATTYYRAVVTSGAGCTPATSNVVTITVYPSVTAGAITGYTTPVCYNSNPGTFQSYPGGGTGSGYTINWYNGFGTFLGSGSSYSPGNLTASTSYYYTVSNACTPAATSATITITVNQQPTVSGSNQAICSNGTSGISLTGTVPGTTFTWTVVQTGVSGATSCGGSCGSSIAQTLVNSGTTPGTATYTVTPLANSCTGPVGTYTVTVNPVPNVIFTPASQTICSGASTNIALTSNVGGTTFSWTVTQSGVTGASAGSGTPIAQTLTNSGTVAGTATYAVTPTANACPGVSQNVIVTVNPKPVATSNPAAQTICSGTATNLTLSSNVPGTSYTWTVVQNGVTGASAGSGSTIAQTLTYSSAPNTATYSITPTANSCAGNVTPVVVTVNPLPAITSVTKTNVTLCGGSNGTITINATGAPPLSYSIDNGANFLTNGGAFSGLPNGNYIVIVKNNYGCTVNYSGNPVQIFDGGAPAAPAGGTNATYCQGTSASNLTAVASAGGVLNWYNNAGLSPSLGTGGSFNPNPYLVTGPNNFYVTETVSGCESSATLITITVNPLPVATATPPAQTICSGTATSIALTSNVGGTSFTWTVVQSNVTGASASNGITISQVISTTGSTTGSATYTIAPTANGCPGSTINVVVTVNPIPVATANPASQIICSGNSTNISLSSPVSGTTFNWTASGSDASGFSNGSGNIISQTLVNSGTTQGTVTYNVIPSANGCNGTAINVVVTVNPIPVTIATPPSQTICSGATTNIALTSGVSGTSFSWTVSQSGVTGASAGSGTTIAQTLTNSGTLQGFATYVVTPTANSCTGAATNIIVTVNPLPATIATPASQPICSGFATSISLSSLVSGATFSWTVTESGVTGATAGSGSVIAQTLTNTGTNPGTATYTVTPSANSCNGNATNVIVTVNPVPGVTATPASQIICSGNATSISLNSPVSSTTFSWTVNTSLDISGASPGSGNIISQTLYNSGVAAGTATYTVTPSANGCNGNPIDVIITINPVPVTIASPTSETICSGSSTNISLNSGVAGATFSWTVTQSGVTGGSNGSGNIIAQTLVRNGTTPGTATYLITPQANGCFGNALSVVVTVNPLPTVSVAESNPMTICSGNTTNINISSNIGSSTFTWTVTEYGVTGGSAGSGTNISQLLSNPWDTAGVAVYTITPAAGSCNGSSLDFTVIVNPVPAATATPASQTICSGSSTGITLNSNVSGTTFSWTVSQSGTSGASNGSGNSIIQTLTYSGTTSGTTTYSVTPSANSCSGTPISIVITVNPIPDITLNPANQTICSGAVANIGISSSVSGAFFSWTVAETLASGALPGSGNNISQNIIATGSTQGNVVFTVTPQANGCLGTPALSTVYVNPLPDVISPVTYDTICSNDTAYIILNSSVPGATFSWTVSQNGVSGASNGTGNLISQILTYTAAPGTVVYSVTPSANGCFGNPYDILYTLNPAPVITSESSTDVTLCGGSDGTITITATGQPPLSYSIDNGANFVSGSTFTNLDNGNYPVVVQNGFGCNEYGSTLSIIDGGAPAAPVAGTDATYCYGDSIADLTAVSGAGGTLTWYSNPSLSPSFILGFGNALSPDTSVGTLSYYVTETFGGCESAPVTIVIVIKPVPVLTATPSAQTLCSGSQANIILTSTLPGTVFNWIVVETDVTGASGGSGNVISDIITTNGNTSGNAVYTVTPELNGCNGISNDVTITVNPIPDVTPSDTGLTICSGDSVNITLVSNVAGTQFGWTVSTTGLITGVSADTSNIISQIPVNNGTSGGTVSYLITPFAGNCSGTPVDITVQVNPIPDAVVNPVSVTLCSKDSVNFDITSNIPGTTFTWTINTNNVAGAVAGSGSFIDQLLSTVLPAPGSVVYTIKPFASGCYGDTASVTAFLNPLPDVTVSPQSQQICSGGQAVVSFTSSFPGVQFSWTVTVTSPDISGAAGGNGNAVNQTIDNLGTVPDSAIYIITPSASGCIGLTDTAYVIINPMPVTDAGNDTIISFGTSATLDGSASGTGQGIAYAWTPADSIASGASSMIAVTNNLTSTTVFTLTITDTLTGCSSVDNMIVTVTGVPLTISGITQNQTICEGSSVQLFVNVIGGSENYTYQWTSNPPGFNSTSQNVMDSPVITTTYTVVTDDGFNTVDSSFTITVNPLPLVTINPFTSVCAQSAAFPLTGGNPLPGSFSGTGVNLGQFNPVVAGTGTHMITYTHTDANGCSNSDSTSITVNPLPVVTLDSIAQVCADAPAFLLTGGSPVGGSYSGPGVVSDSLYPVIAGSGSYTVTYTYTDSLGCSDSASRMIVINPVPVATISDFMNVSCYGLTDGTATVSGSQGTLPYSYLWDNIPADTVTIADGLDANVVYHVTLTDHNQCRSYDSVSVSEPAALNLSITSVSTTCNFVNGSATTIVSGGIAPYSYQWSDGSLTQGISNVSAGNYSVTVTDNNNCTITGNTTVNASTGIFGNIQITDVTCFGKADGNLSVTVTGTPPYSYLWSTGDTISMITGLAPGNYTLAVIDSNNCMLIDTVNVTGPDSLRLNFIKKDIECKGDFSGWIYADVQGGTPPYAHLWSTGNTSDTLVCGANISYCDTITDGNGCKISGCEMLTDPDQLLTLSVDSVRNVTCWGGSDGYIRVEVTGGVMPYQFIWNTNPIQTTQAVSGLVSGITYIVTVTDSVNCRKELTILINQPSKIDTVRIIETEATCEEGDDGRLEVVASGGTPPYEFIWFSEPQQDSSLATGLKPGKYELRISDDKSCYQNFQVILSGKPVACLVIPTVFTPNADDKHDKWVIKNIHLYPDVTIDVFNRWGNMIFNGGVNEQWDGTYNGTPVPGGVYIYIINLNNGTEPKQGTVTIVR